MKAKDVPKKVMRRVLMLERQVLKGLRRHRFKLETGRWADSNGKCACAVGAALLSESKDAKKLGEKLSDLVGVKVLKYAQRKLDRGIKLDDLRHMEAGFEDRRLGGICESVDHVPLNRENPFFKLGVKLRQRANRLAVARQRRWMARRDREVKQQLQEAQQDD